MCVVTREQRNNRWDAYSNSLCGVIALTVLEQGGNGGRSHQSFLMCIFLNTIDPYYSIITVTAFIIPPIRTFLIFLLKGECT